MGSGCACARRATDGSNEPKQPQPERAPQRNVADRNNADRNNVDRNAVDRNAAARITGGRVIDPALADALALAVSVAPPAQFWADIELAAAHVRTAGTGPVLAPTDSADPVVGYERAVAEIVALGRNITLAEWSLPTVNRWNVLSLFAHVAVAERWFAWRMGLAELGPGPEFGPDETDHVAFTAGPGSMLAALGPSAVVAELDGRGRVVTERLRQLDETAWDRIARFYAFEGPLSGNVIARIFELWTHLEDVLRSLQRPLQPPDPGRLRMMSTVATALLPAGMAMAGIDARGCAVRLVLTGPGGGMFVAPLSAGAHPATTDVVLVADVVDFCRVVARRLAVDELNMVTEGDATLARQVLVAASMLAAD
jgi:uncharacterized protein (TIGR03083 family)